MDRNFASDEVNKRLARVRDCLKALQCAKSAIPKEGEMDGDGVYCLISVLGDAAISELDVATDDLIDYMVSWQD
jgi:hypothetical protein